METMRMMSDKMQRLEEAVTAAVALLDKLADLDAKIAAAPHPRAEASEALGAVARCDGTASRLRGTAGNIPGHPLAMEALAMAEEYAARGRAYSDRRRAAQAREARMYRV